MSTRAVRKHKQSGLLYSGKPKNLHYEADIRYVLQMCRWFFRPMGLWCMVYPDTSDFEKIVSFCAFLACLSVMMFCMISPVNFILYERKVLLPTVTLCGVIGYCLTTTIKYGFLCLRGSSFGNCIRQLERDWKAVEDPKYRAIMLKQVSITRYLVPMSAGILYLGGFCLHLVVPIIALVRARQHGIKPRVPTGYSFLYNSKISHPDELVIIMEYFAGLIKYSVTSCCFSLTTIFVTHIIGQIQIQISRLGDYVTDVRVKGTDSMGSIIEEHVTILRFSKTMCESFHEICLVQITESVLIICTVAFFLIMESEKKITAPAVTCVVLLGSFIFNLFIFCYLGEMLSEQCSEIGPSAYNIEWYNLTPKQARNVIMLCKISLYPPKLTGAKMIHFCMTTFSSVMQTSVVYLNLLRTFSNWLYICIIPGFHIEDSNKHFETTTKFCCGTCSALGLIRCQYLLKFWDPGNSRALNCYSASPSYSDLGVKSLSGVFTDTLLGTGR